MIRLALAKARARHEASEHWRDQFGGLNRPLRCFAREDFGVSRAALGVAGSSIEPDRFQVSIAPGLSLAIVRTFSPGKDKASGPG